MDNDILINAHCLILNELFHPPVSHSYQIMLVSLVDSNFIVRMLFKNVY